MMDMPNRRPRRLALYDYSQAGSYFVTICTQNHACLFGEVVNGKFVENEFGIAVRGCWEAIPKHFPSVGLDLHIVMPNHIHGIISIVGARHAVPLQRESFGKPVIGSLSTIIRSYKSAVTKRINELRNEAAIIIWQRNYYEHVIRTEAELNRIRQYIIENPLKWELDPENPHCVSNRDVFGRANDYPFVSKARHAVPLQKMH